MTRIPVLPEQSGRRGSYSVLEKDVSCVERLIGKKAPWFSMEALAADGEHFTRVSLSDYEGKWLVLFFYPMDFTFVCPTELTAFSDSRERFAQVGAELLCVSTDSVYTHLAWQRNGLGKLGYPMGADQTLKVCDSYGVLLEEEGVALRGLFLIDPEQKVRYSVIHDNNIGRNPDEVLRVLAALQTGGLCAAGWQAGEETLHPQIPEQLPAVGAAKDVPVQIYTMPTCSYCRSVKEFLRDAGVAYQEFNLEHDKAGQAFMKDRGYTGLPVTVIGGEEIVGYDMPRIKAALGLV